MRSLRLAAIAILLATMLTINAPSPARDGAVLTPRPDRSDTRVVTERHANGKLAKQYTEVNGKAQGAWFEWDENGRLTHYSEWKAGKGDGVWLYFHPNGMVRERSFARDDIWDGPSEGWHANGTKAYEGMMVDGAKGSGFQYWDEDGTPIAPLQSLDPAGREPMLFLADSGWEDAPNQWELALSPTEDVLFFATGDSDGENRRIVMRRWRNGEWGAVEPAPFAHPGAAEGGPMMAADGEWLYFSSDRHVATEPENRLRDLYRVSRSSGWVKVERVTATLAYGEVSLSVAKDGTGVLWTGQRLDGSATMGFYVVSVGADALTDFVSLNDLHTGDISNENNGWIDPDGRYIIFANYDIGKPSLEDLFVTRRTDDGWSTPISLGPLINGRTNDRYPLLTPDGRFLVYGSDRSGKDRYYAIPVAAIPAISG